MPTVPQPYVYAISSIPGGVFGGQQSDRLLWLIQNRLVEATNPVISSDSVNVIITFDTDLTVEQKTTLDELVPHSADYFIITLDGSTDIGDPANIKKPAGQESSTRIILQIKSGDGSDFRGFGESVDLHAPLMTIDRLEGTFNESGQFSFTIGAELSRGQVEIYVEASGLPSKTIIARWS